MSADPSTPVDPAEKSGGFVVQNMIFDGSSKGSMEVITHWRAYEGTRQLEQYYVPPCKPDMSRLHPCFDVNATLAACCEALDPEMLMSGRAAACNLERQALMRCLTRQNRLDRQAGKKSDEQSVADIEGTWGSWIKGLFSAKPSTKRDLQ